MRVPWRRPKQIEPARVDEPARIEDHADLRAATATFLSRFRVGGYDFLDLGTNDGGGFEIARLLGGTAGLGFDVEPGAVRRASAKGFDVALHDVCQLGEDRDLVDFAVCSHVLEHLPDLDAVAHVLASLKALCRRYIIICGPCFETEAYLAERGLAVLHSLMLDHTCKMKVSDLIAILHRLELRDYVVGLSFRMKDSDFMWIHAKEQPVGPEGLWSYEAGKHLPKPSVAFDDEIYRDFVCVVKLAGDVDCDEVLRDFMWGYDRIVDRSSWVF